MYQVSLALGSSDKTDTHLPEVLSIHRNGILCEVHRQAARCVVFCDQTPDSIAFHYLFSLLLAV